MLPRITVDFNTQMADPKGRVLIPTHVNPELLEILKPQLRVILYEENDLEVEATVEFDEKYNEWLGMPDWSTLRHLDA